MVALGANACIIGRNVEKTENMAKDIATVRPGAKVIGIGAVDVRKPNFYTKQPTAAQRSLEASTSSSPAQQETFSQQSTKSARMR
jgi:hypothetical protein